MNASHAGRDDGIHRLGLDELAPELRELLQPTVDRLGYLGEFFQVAGHVPGAVQHFMAYTQAVKAPLSNEENELLALATCATLGADYERIQHERLALKLGMTPAWIAAACDRVDADPAVLNPAQHALRRLAVGVSSRAGHRCAQEIRAVVDALGQEKAAAAVLQTTRFVLIAHVCNALQLSLPVPSIFTQAGASSPS